MLPSQLLLLCGGPCVTLVRLWQVREKTSMRCPLEVSLGGRPLPRGSSCRLARSPSQSTPAGRSWDWLLQLFGETGEKTDQKGEVALSVVSRITGGEDVHVLKPVSMSPPVAHETVQL